MRVDLRDSIWRDTQKARYHTTPHHFELPTHHTHKVATLNSTLNTYQATTMSDTRLEILLGATPFHTLLNREVIVL